jgi:hypothetical protein
MHRPFTLRACTPRLHTAPAHRACTPRLHTAPAHRAYTGKQTGMRADRQALRGGAERPGRGGALESLLSLFSDQRCVFRVLRVGKSER